MYSPVESARVVGIDLVASLVELATRSRQDPRAVLPPADFKTPAGTGRLA
jgi:hypothetical protein